MPVAPLLARFPAGLPLSRRLEAIFAAQVKVLPERTRHVLLLVALDGTGDPRSCALTALVRMISPAAEWARLAYVDHRTRLLAFRHPLIGAAVVGLSTDNERRRPPNSWPR